MIWKNCRVVIIIIFTNLSARAGYDTRPIFKRSLKGLNSEFSFSYTSCLTKAEESSLPYYLPIARWRIIGFVPFPRVLVLCEMLSVSSRIWTHVAVSISYDDNHYTTGTSTGVIVIMNEKRHQNLNLARELKKAMKQAGSFDTNYNWFTWNGLQRLRKGTSWKSEDEPWHPKLEHCEDRPEYCEEFWTLEETCCYLDSREKPSANAGVKSSLEVIL